MSTYPKLVKLRYGGEVSVINDGYGGDSGLLEAAYFDAYGECVRVEGWLNQADVQLFIFEATLADAEAEE